MQKNFMMLSTKAEKDLTARISCIPIFETLEMQIDRLEITSR